MVYKEKKEETEFQKEFQQRILVLDGAMGTMIQQAHLTEADFRGLRFSDSKCELKGCNDVLVLTRPDVVEQIHRQYLAAGADIIETDTFNANAVSLADYQLQDDAYEINLTAARLAKNVVAQWRENHPEIKKWVAGSVGPTNKSLSMSPDVSDPAARNITWKALTEAYDEQMRGLLDGGVDVLLIETVFDTLNAKAALWAARVAMERVKRTVPVMLSLTLTEGGRTLSGQTLEAFLASVAHADCVSVGLNCGFGALGMEKWTEQLAALTDRGVSVYPNAGLPNEMGEYDETAAMMGRHLTPALEKGLVNIVGGCCGTTPDHIKAIAELADKFTPRQLPQLEKKLRLSGLEPIDVVKERNFVNVGERCNVAGSRKFLRLINEKKYDEAVSIACRQVEDGAQIIDVNMDDAMLDAPAEMEHFLHLLASEPDAAKAPVMIDSSKWETVTAGLECLQGKGIVNSISLKDGAERFKEKATYVKNMGAAVVVMAFDEVGQADTFERKVEVCQRAYDILTREVGFPENDIIFDPNVLAVATGIESHNNYAVDFIRATEWIKTHLPGAKVSGGLSNLSFSFRGNNAVREAMHSAFLFHAIAKGMDMAIVNAGAIIPYDDIEPALRECIENVIFNRSADATDRLVEMASEIKNQKSSKSSEAESESPMATLSNVSRLEQMIVKGRSEGIEECLALVHDELHTALAVIDGPLMNGMNRVGKLFGENKLFLPQVVKSARTMKQAVEWLNPLIAKERVASSASKTGLIVIATVKGDVHDIGKNIVTVILRCNGYEVIDLGVMVPGEEIVDCAIAKRADIVALSGLITPSLEEMRKVAALMQSRGLDIPLMVGGATTSELHTAVKIAPEYDGPVVHTRDAALMPVVAQRLLTDRKSFMAEWLEKQNDLRIKYNASKELFSLDEARCRHPQLTYVPLAPKKTGVHDLAFTINEVRKYINWRPFFAVWEFDASMASLAEVKGCDCRRAVWLAQHNQSDMERATQAMQLYKEANEALDFFERTLGEGVKARVGLFECTSDGDDIVVDNGARKVRIPMLRQQKRTESEACLSLCDYFAPKELPVTDYVGLFAVTVGKQMARMIAYQREKHDDYKAMLYQTLGDRLAEAATELMHRKVRRELWGYAADEPGNPDNLLLKYYQGIRPAVGYPSMPDQSVIFKIDDLLDVEATGIELTVNGAMNPAASTCGLMIAHPDSRYFYIGAIGDDQREDYARRRGVTLDELSKWLP